VPKILDPSDLEDNKFSTRRVAPDTLEIDDAAGRSDEDQVVTPSRRRTPHNVSADTRDLIDFLSQGPPDDSPPPVSLVSNFHSSLNTSILNTICFTVQSECNLFGQCEGQGIGSSSENDVEVVDRELPREVAISNDEW
jgi:hypothetical protein